MKLWIKACTVFILLVFIVNFIIPVTDAQAGETQIKILFTHDLHDHLLPASVEQNGVIVNSGGYARLKTAIEREKSESPDALLLDGGDYSMGTLFQSIYASDAPELRIMGALGFDATTFGNHEFDFRSSGMTRELYAAKNSGDKLPQIVSSNITFPEQDKMTKSLLDLKQAMQAYGVKDYTILERNGLKIGVFGLIGKDSAKSAPMAEVTFGDAVVNAKRVVNQLKNKEKVDMIVCLSHSGTWTDKSVSEDELLAKKVPEIDVIISGHTHTKLDKPIIVGNTIIGSCGEYCGNLGSISLSRVSNGWQLKDYKLIPIDDSLAGDAQIAESINKYKAVVQQKYLDNFGMKFDDVLAYSPFSFIPASQIGVKHGEEPLGNLISDAYVYAVKRAEGDKYEPITASIVTVGVMRGSFTKGDITVSDAFTSDSLGIGPDGVAGYPLISVYLTGKELKTACEVDASISPMMSSAQLYMTGISFTFNPNRIIFNKVTKAELQNPDGSLAAIQDDKLYRVVTGLYNAQMLSLVGEKSFGLLSIVPKTKDGKPVTDFEAQIIYDTTSSKQNEVKEWLAIAQYLKSFDKTGGVPQVPQYYNEMHGRKIVDDSHSIAAVLSHPNSVALKLYTVIFVVVAVLVLVCILIVRKVRRRRRKAKKLLKM